MQGLPRGGGPTFFEFGRVACPEVACGAWRSHAFALLGAYAPQENIFKWCNLVHFRIYFDKVLT